MPRKVSRTAWRAIALDMSIESSEMEVMVHRQVGERRRHGRQKRPIVRVILRTESGKVFSGPRISKALQKELERLAVSGPWIHPRRQRR